MGSYHKYEVELIKYSIYAKWLLITMYLQSPVINSALNDIFICVAVRTVLYVLVHFPCAQDPPRSYPPVPPEERAPLRVLGLFDGIATGERRTLCCGLAGSVLDLVDCLSSVRVLCLC